MWERVVVYVCSGRIRRGGLVLWGGGFMAFRGVALWFVLFEFFGGSEA